MSSENNGKERRTEVIRFLNGRTAHFGEYLELLIESDMRHLPPRAITWGPPAIKEDPPADGPKPGVTKRLGEVEPVDKAPNPKKPTVANNRDPRRTKSRNPPEATGPEKDQTQGPLSPRDPRTKPNRDPRLRKIGRANPRQYIRDQPQSDHAATRPPANAARTEKEGRATQHAPIHFRQ